MTKIISAIVLLVSSTAVFAQTAPAAAPNPVCVSAWNALSKAKQTENVKILKETQCAIIYKNGWLAAGTGVENKTVCVKPWNDLAAANMQQSGKDLVSNNCAIMVKNGWKPNP